MPNGDGSIVLNGTASVDNALDISNGAILLPAGEYTAMVSGINKINSTYDRIYVSAKGVVIQNNIIADSPRTFTLSEESVVSVYMVYKAGSTYSNTVVKVQIEAGKTATEWEPYTGGIPSPNPDYPQPLESVGDGGSVGVTVAGKNLFDGVLRLKYRLIANGDNRQITNSNTPSSAIIKVVPNTTYTVSGDYSAATDGYFRYAVFQEHPGMGSISIKHGSTKKAVSIDIPENGNYLLLWFIDSPVTEAPIQIEVGSTVTDYEPYKEPQILSVSTPNSLPGIPVTSGGNYTDENGQQWICDEVDFASGKYVQKVYTESFDGSEDELWLSGGLHNLYYHKSKKATIPRIGGLCNRYVHSLDANVERRLLIGGDINIYDSRFASATEWKTNLQSNPITVMYPIAEPIYHDLSAEELAQYTALHTNYPNTTIYNDIGADMEVKYYTPTTAVQMVHSPSDEGKVLAIDEHGCVVLTDDIGGGDITIDLSSSDNVDNSGNPINADTLGGYSAEEYVRKDQYGIELNYSVVGSMEEPVNPTQNMIWIQTETPIGRVFFGNDEPNETFINGDVWIRTGSSSSVSFNSLKIGSNYMDMVCPISAKQYVSGAWVDVDAMSYHGSEWVEWVTYLYNAGDECTDLTGGWSANNVTASNGVSVNALTISKNTDNIVLQQQESQKSACFSTVNAIDVTEYKKVYFEVSFKRNSDSTGAWCMFCIHPNRSLPRDTAETELYGSDYENQVFEVNIENLSGNHYMSFAIYSTCTVTVRKVWLE